MQRHQMEAEVLADTQTNTRTHTHTSLLLGCVFFYHSGEQELFSQSFM